MGGVSVLSGAQNGAGVGSQRAVLGVQGDACAIKENGNTVADRRIEGESLWHQVDGDFQRLQIVGEAPGGGQRSHRSIRQPTGVGIQAQRPGPSGGLDGEGKGFRVIGTVDSLGHLGGEIGLGQFNWSMEPVMPPRE